MWHEAYAPQTLADVTWSMVKLRELADWHPFDSGHSSHFIERKTKPKKTTPSVIPPPASAPQYVQRPVMVMHGPSGCGKLSVLKIALKHGLRFVRDQDGTQCDSVFFSVEHTCDELETFLSDALRTAGTGQVFIVKELPATFESGRPGSPVMEVLRRFVRTVEGILSRGGTVPAIVFLHTAHDTHSAKVDLFRAFPAECIDSKRVQLFHCTPATTLSICSRLRTVATLALGPLSEGLLPSELIAAISESARGDIRQALLQLQWVTLTLKQPAVPPPVSQPRRPQPKPATVKAIQSSVINLLDEDEDAIECTTSSDDEAGTAAPSEVQPAGSALLLHLLQRDDYIDVAHGAARVLTQKYKVEDVLQRLTVPPERLMAYIAGNLHRYFDRDGFESFARAVAGCSTFDRANAVARDPTARMPSNPLTLSADEIAIRCFGAEYATLSDVRIPRDFAGLSPLPPVTPALLHLCRRAPLTSTLDDDAETTSYSKGFKRPLEVNAWRSEMEAAASRLRAELYALHPTSSTNDVCFDVLPLLPRILLSDPRAAVRQPVVSTAPNRPAGGTLATPAMPKRTMFVPGNANKPLALAPQPLRVTDVIESLAKHQLGPYASWSGHAQGVVVVAATTVVAPESGDAVDPISDFDD